MFKDVIFNWFYTPQGGWDKADNVIRYTNGLPYVNAECGLCIVQEDEKSVEIRFYDHTHDKRYFKSISN